jgi:hypothetical protein
LHSLRDRDNDIHDALYLVPRQDRMIQRVLSAEIWQKAMK